MSTLTTSPIEDAIAALADTGNPVMTVRVSEGNIDLVTKQGLEQAYGNPSAEQGTDGLRVAVTEKETRKVEMDVSPEMAAQLEKTFQQSPNQQSIAQNALDVTALERMFASSPSPSKPTPTIAAVEEKQPITITPVDAAQAIYSLELNPELLNSTVLKQLEAFGQSQSLGENSSGITDQIMDKIGQARPDLQGDIIAIREQRQAQPQAYTLGQAAQMDAQGEVQKIVANSSGSQAQTNAQVEKVSIPVAQTFSQGEIALPKPNMSGSQVEEATSHGRVTPTTQRALA